MVRTMGLTQRVWVGVPEEAAPQRSSEDSPSQRKPMVAAVRFQPTQQHCSVLEMKGW